ncbi:MAG: hypothetical protein NWT08_00970 [Akkermansiaceae bacterium]|nr:hypothetical protein [Akkermansiaceae bacterium]MDP4721656.1 hypothetical protein [Akkermansiaceae bacterium]MDP4778828.1 hypothetical protein [Akkermansiaceae bacterium]MDP4846971.1 hypothetical protein [Akkermansiaceae bacterium]
MNGGSGTLSECGFLIGSPAHVIKRAVAILPGASGCEVAKIAFGDDGRMALEKEAEMLRRLQGRATGAPILTGIDTRDGATVMKMPYDEGRPYHKTALNPILKLLMRWLTGTQQAFYDFRMEG